MCVCVHASARARNTAELENYGMWFVISNCITVSITFILFYTNCLACRDYRLSGNWNQCSHFTSATHRYYGAAQANLQCIIIVIMNSKNTACALSLPHTQEGDSNHIHTQKHVHWWPSEAPYERRMLRGFWGVIQSCRHWHILTWWRLLLPAKHMDIYHLCMSISEVTPVCMWGLHSEF